MPSAPSTAPEQPARPVGGHGPRAARHLVVLLPLLLLLATGLRGIDFGKHWDERVQVDVLHTAIDSQTLLPKWYRYPSVMFWMNLGALTPEIVAQIPRDAAQMKATQARLNTTVESPGFRLRMRTVFLAVTCLTVLWTYLLALTCYGSVVGAFLAASLIGLSWEVAYHARWIAPDGILMQFSTLTLLLLALGATRRDGRWLLGAALAAGLACGTKYTGGILLIPLWIAAAQVWKEQPLRARAGRAAGLAGVFVLTFVVSTPGAILQPFIFLRHVGFEIDHYRTGHYGATIDAGLPHLGAMVRYLGAHLFSHRAGMALLVSAAGGVGLLNSLRRSPRMALLLVSFPIAYVLYMSTQRVMFVRNLLLVAPVIAVFAAHGAAGLGSSMTRDSGGRSARTRGGLAAAGVLAIALWAVNASYLVTASESIRKHDTDADVRAFSAWADAHPEQRIFLSTRVANRLARLELAPPPNSTRADGPDVDAVAFFPAETLSSNLRANRPGTALAIFGALDVNFEFYPAWKEPKLLVYPADAARDAGILGDR